MEPWGKAVKEVEGTSNYGPGGGMDGGGEGIVGGKREVRVVY